MNNMNNNQTSKTPADFSNLKINPDAGAPMNTSFTAKYDQQMLEYFNTLPKYIQESIMQSGAEIACRQDLEQIAANISEAKKFE